MATFHCFSCHKSFELGLPAGRRDNCPHCYADAKVCRNCRFHDKGAYHECTEPQAEWVEDKEKGNFCDYFEPGTSSGGPAPSIKDDPALAKLFKI